MTSFDPNSIFQFAGYMFFVVFMFFGAKLQMYQMLAQISRKMKRLLVLRNSSIEALRTHILKHIATLTPDQDMQLATLIESIAIPPVSNLDPAGIVPKMENIFKTYEKYLKNGLRRIVNVPGMPGEIISQSDLENLTNSLEVAVELNIFYKVVEHFVKLAKKVGVMAVWQIAMILPMLMEMAEALGAASGHFNTGMPIGDSFGPMVARKLSGTSQENRDISNDPETSVFTAEFEGRKLVIIKAKGPGGSVGNPGKVAQEVITTTQPSLVITIDAGLKLESEKTGDISEGVGVAMGGPGMDRFRIEEALVKFDLPVLTVVCKMSMKDAISQMPKEVLDQVESTFSRVLRMIRENSESGQTVVIIGVGNSMGVD